MLRFICRTPEPQWPQPDGMSEILWRLLGARGVGSEREARAFLNPCEEQIADPSLLSNMDEAVRVIREAAGAGKPVCIWGDYDVDGVCATAILDEALRGLGMRPETYLPSRHEEGYGLNERGIAEIAGRGGLLVTVDCGISAAELIDKAKELGLTVVVTDHHQLGKRLPDCTVLNPLLGEYPNPALCGAGVAFQLARALDQGRAMELIDLAAIATVADVVSLTGENRAIVALGLERINRAARPGIAALMDVAGIKGSIRAGSVGFQIGPRLNAGGRVGSARQALDLLRAQAPEAALPLALALDAQNEQRRAMEYHIVRDVEALLAQTDLSKARAIVLAGQWSVGVVGLAASRMVEKYHLPTILLAKNDAPEDGEVLLTGSCRSIPGVNIFEVLCAASDLLIRFGGHKQAAGLTLIEANLDALRERVNGWIEENTDPEAFIPRAEYDARVALGEVDEELTRELEKMQPCGFGNPAPVLLCEGCVEKARGVGREGSHLSFTLEEEGEVRRGVWFSHGEMADELEGSRRQILFVPKVDSYRGRVSVQLEAKAMRLASLSAALDMDDETWEALLHRFLTHALYNRTVSEKAGWTAPELARRLRGSLRGSLVLAADAQSAKELLEELSRLGVANLPDVFAGRFPEDRRAWNAMCLLPVGEIPAGYDSIYCLGAPGALLAPGRECREAGSAASWLADLPDTDGLRRLYVAVRDTFRYPWAGKSALVLARALGDLAKLTPGAAHAGLEVLSQMELLTYRSDPLRLEMLPLRKVSPAESPLFVYLEQLRTWGGGNA